MQSAYVGYKISYVSLEASMISVGKKKREWPKCVLVSRMTVRAVTTAKARHTINTRLNLHNSQRANTDRDDFVFVT